MHLEKIWENVYCYRDYINVYIVQKGNSAILIDFGSGKVLNYLHEISVDTVDYIFHTHYHRDQCYGDKNAVEKGIKIACSTVEKKLFSEAELFWKTVTYFNLYVFKPTFFLSTYDIPISFCFNHGDIFEWNGITFKIVETKGHTMGSISFIVRIQGKTIVFSGDLIFNGGRVLNYWDLQYYYNANGDHGIRFTLESLRRLSSFSPDLLLPSHGESINDPKEDFALLEKKLERARFVFRTENSGLYTEYFPPQTLKAANLREFRSIYHNGTSYVIYGKHNNAIIVDYAGEEPPFGFEIKHLKRKLDKKEIKTVDFVIPSHYHDDHVTGINLLREIFDTKIYAIEKMVDILENPGDYRMGCVANVPVKVDRILKDGEKFEWDGIEMTAYHFPGQTEYHMGLLAEIDGKRIFFIGDSFSQSLVFDRHNSVNCWNFCWLGEKVGYMKCADILLECKPDYLALPHYAIIQVTEENLQKYKEVVSEYESTIADLVPYDNPNFGFDPNWISFKPIRIISQPDSTLNVELCLRNYSDKHAELEINLNLPSGWKAEYQSKVNVPATTFQSFPVKISIPTDESPTERTIITANIIWNGSNMGPIPDLTVDHGFKPATVWEGWQITTGISLKDWMDIQRDIRYNFFTFKEGAETSKEESHSPNNEKGK